MNHLITLSGTLVFFIIKKMANVKETDSYDHPPLDTLNIFYNLENAFQYRNGVFLFERLTNLFFKIFFLFLGQGYDSFKKNCS